MDQVTQLLQALAAQLGVSVEYLWPYLVRYTFANHLSIMIGNLIEGLVLIGLAFLSVHILRLGWGKDMGEDSPSPAFFQTFAGIVGFIACVIFALVCIEGAFRHVAGVMVPEAQAVLDLLDKVTPKK